MKLKILFLSANPHQDLSPDEEYRIIENIVNKSSVRDNIFLIPKFAVRIDDIISTINEVEPHIVHFTGHGTKNGELSVTDSSGDMDELLSTESLEKLFLTTKSVKLVFLSACHSVSQAKAISTHIDYVIGMNREINDMTAMALAETFYGSIFTDKSINDAFNQAIVRLETEYKEEADIPKLLVDNFEDISIFTIIKGKYKQKNQEKLYASIPTLPPEYLPREEDMREIKKILLDKGNQSIGITGVSKKLGLHGMGGIGKSIFSIALGHDAEVREHFSDGIYFIQLGQNPDIVDIQINLLYYFGIENPNTKTIKADIASIFVDKKALLIIDDTWNIRDLNAFEIRGKNSKIVITTRQKDIVTAMGAKEYPIDLLSKEQSLMLLEKKVGKIGKDLLPLSKKLLERCGYLPLAINIIGSILQEQGIYKNILEEILEDLESSNLEYIEYTNQNEQHENLYRVIDLSVNYLDEKIRDKYLSLSIFEDRKRIPRESLKNYWGRDFRRVIGKLLSSSLIFQEIDDKNRVRYYIHDLQTDYIRFIDRDKKLRYREFMNSYQKRYKGRWSDISMNDFLFYRKYLEICEKIDEIDLAKEISENILFHQNKINLSLIKKIISLLELDEQLVASKLLWKNKHPDSLVWILNILGKNSEEVQAFAKRYIEQDMDLINSNLTIKCLDALDKEFKEIQLFAKSYIKQDIRSIETPLMVKCLDVLDGNSEEIQEFVEGYIEKNIDTLDGNIIIKCLNILGKNTKKVQEFAKRYIQQDIDILDGNLTIKCLDILDKDLDKIELFSKQYLQGNINNLDRTLSIKCLKILGKESKESKIFAEKYIEKEENNYLLYNCLSLLSIDNKKRKKFAQGILEKKINGKLKLRSFVYTIQAQILYTEIDNQRLREKIALERISSLAKKFNQRKAKFFADNRALYNACLLVLKDKDYIKEYLILVLNSWWDEIVCRKKHQGRYYHAHIVRTLENPIVLKESIEVAKKIREKDTQLKQEAKERGDEEYMFLSPELDEVVERLINMKIMDRESSLGNDG